MQLLRLFHLSVFTVFLCACTTPLPPTILATPSTQDPIQAPNIYTIETTQQFLEARIGRDPEDYIAHNKLALEYLQRLRETGDAGYLNRAAESAKASLASLPAERNKSGLIAWIQVAHAAHDFVGARDHAQQLIKLEPNKGYAYQFLGDALLELGQYAEAAATYQQMQALGGIHDLTKVAMAQRMGRLTFLFGDTQGALRHFQDALNLIPDAPAQRELKAWTQWQLGDSAFSHGDYVAAENYYRAALATFPDYFHALAALGRVHYARGDLPGAIALFEQVVQRLPDPALVATLGDLYQLAGRTEDAAAQLTLVEQISQLNAGLHDRQLVLFYADHGLKAESAYALASSEYAQRQDIYGADALAWTALKAGKIDHAQRAIQEALKLGTQDAKLYYHAGMIAQASGDRVNARRYLQTALRLNPAFDPLQAQYARAALHTLQ